MQATPADFPLIGEPLALDLINTRVHTPDGDDDLLSSPDALAAWLQAQAERLPQPDAPLTSGDVAAVQAIREQVRTAIDHARHRRRPPAGALHALNDAQRKAPSFQELSWDGARVVATVRRSVPYTERLCAELAQAASELLTSPSLATVRACDGPGCVLLFLPAHPRRRWCSPALCGNRVRVARYYERHKQREG